MVGKLLGMMSTNNNKQIIINFAYTGSDINYLEKDPNALISKFIKIQIEK